MSTEHPAYQILIKKAKLMHCEIENLQKENEILKNKNRILTVLVDKFRPSSDYELNDNYIL